MTTILNFRTILAVTLILTFVHTKILVMDVEDLRKLKSKKDFRGLRKLMGPDLGGEVDERKLYVEGSPGAPERRLFGATGPAKGPGR